MYMYSNSRRWHLISICTRKVPTCSVGAVTLSSRPAQAVLPMALSPKLSPLPSPCPQSPHALHLTRGSGNPPANWWWFGPSTCCDVALSFTLCCFVHPLA